MNLANKMISSIVPAKYKWPKGFIVWLNMKKYKQQMGYKFDIHNPISFTEKLQWYKMFYSHPDLKRIIDKYIFKEYIQEKLGSGMTIPLVVNTAWNSISEVREAWDCLPEEFVLKSTISSNGRNILFVHNKKNVNIDKILLEVKTWFEPKNTMLNQFCTGYYDCTPRVIAEEYMETIKGQLFDYKIFCFNGEPYFVYAASEHFEGKDHHSGYPISFYDFEWNKLNIQYGPHRNGDITKPVHLEEMISCAEKLSKGFPFVRIDFFDTPRKLFLAEMTFYPGGGLTPYKPNEINMQMGEKFILPIRKS